MTKQAFIPTIYKIASARVPLKKCLYGVVFVSGLRLVPRTNSLVAHPRLHTTKVMAKVIAKMRAKVRIQGVINAVLVKSTTRRGLAADVNL